MEILGRVLKVFFGSRNERLLRNYQRLVAQVEQLEQRCRELSDAELQASTPRLRERFAQGATVEEILPEAFALLREASRRAQNHRHFNCQLIGGLVLFKSNIAEMKTGEGKTIVCHLPSYLKVLQGLKVHIVTVNDYLVKRDAEFAQPIFERLGVTVGFIQAHLDSGGAEGVRRVSYSCDITYGTNSEFGFDYLRDNMKHRLEDQVQGRLDYVIVDEVDSILVDEARTPLIISGPAHDDVTRYKWADQLARMLVSKQQQADGETARQLSEWGANPPKELLQNPRFEGAVARFKVDPTMLTEEEAEAIGHKQFYVVQRERKAVQVTHDGIEAAQNEAKIGSFFSGENMDRPHLIEQAVRARVVYERDKEYVVQNGEVIIVDEFTGRLMHGRQWSDGLHQAVEAKEGVRVKEESQTMATITIQNYFKLYQQIAGMTGTAMTESEEFMKIYKLEVVEIPTNRPINRVDHNDKIYSTFKTKYDAIVEEINAYHRYGRPVDPFLLEPLLNALLKVRNLNAADKTRLEQALAKFKETEQIAPELIEVMTEAYDQAMGNLVRGRPVLVGTTSVENSEKLSNLLSQRYGIEHEVLNAKFHAREAEIVAKAGHTHAVEHGDRGSRGNVTIATNMAGRGTDIKLSLEVVNPGCKVPNDSAASVLYPVGTTKCCIRCSEYDPATHCQHCFKPKLDPRFPEIGRQVCSLNPPCGLHIIGTERHEARRIDNQLRGRAGRQGDPGSSRFFLSLDDDLLKLFMPDWMLKMMDKWGLAGGMSLEHRQISKGIERAQRKVEERNFNIRKNLLEWDEPLNYQRKAFYALRQRVLRRQEIEQTLWQMVEESIVRAVRRYLDPQYPAECIAEWVRSKLDIAIAPEKLTSEEVDRLEETIRRVANSEMREALQTSLSEYLDPDTPEAEWDLAGLSHWAARSCNVQLSQNQLRKMDRDQIEEAILEGAEKHIEHVDLTGVAVYLDPVHGRNALAEWARGKFGMEVKLSDLTDLEEAAATELLIERARTIYRQREIDYPVENIMQRALNQGGPENAYAAQLLTAWINGKYQLDWSVEQVQQKSPKELFDELRQLNQSYLTNGRMESEITQALSRHQGEELKTWARKRFGPTYRDELINGEDTPAALRQMGRELLRWELTSLEQYVLLRTYDMVWKDHLLEMDHLKSAIQQRPLGGDQTHPQSQFAIEGKELFDQMWDRVREHVTDRIFKVRLAAGDGEGGEGGIGRPSGGPRPLNYQHLEATGAGFATAAGDQEAAMRAQGQQKVETIRREEPKVGRNDPCPCGSGKKYKQCHGRSG
ncbi:MAG: Protein translocase subunit SecA [Phycisphaerae bacterium]|nr:Protein translocase subunit SecA [Phycisphaerae bacterium]